MNKMPLRLLEILGFMLIISGLGMLLTGCGGSGGGSSNPATETTNNETATTEEALELTDLDQQLALVITDQDLAGHPTDGRNLPDISEPLAQLGKMLFYSQSLGGDFDAACVSCHHPSLGGADALSLPMGVGANNPELLGPGRSLMSGDATNVPRNAPTVFNAGLWDSGLFWDSRVESLGKETNANGSNSGIRTPDTSYLVADTDAGVNLPAAQAAFPVTSAEEMKGVVFENGSDITTIRNHLAARIGDYGVGNGELARNDWLDEFQIAFSSADTAENLISFDNIISAIGAFEQSMVFVQSPWQDYLDGDISALNDQQKRGALLFFNSVADGGVDCVACHSGPLLSDENHHTVAFPQIGPGKGDGASADEDFGRERETGDSDHRYQFRTPSLLNIAVTAPYGHAGAYDNLTDAVRHYRNPRAEVERYFNRGGYCQLEQFEEVANCQSLYPNSEDNSLLMVTKLENDQATGNSDLPDNLRLDDDEVADIVAFLEALTDPCVEDRECLEPWIANNTTDNPDDQVLIAIDGNNIEL